MAFKVQTKICIYFDDGSSACFFDSDPPAWQGVVTSFEILFPGSASPLLASGPCAWLAFRSIVGLRALSALSVSPASIGALSDFLGHVSTIKDDQLDLPALAAFWSSSLELHQSRSV